jgi:glycosyltransferase involved in cell wall biosynthesis
MRDRVSVIIPTYNYGHFVGDAVESALRQTWRGGAEVIVVDAGSRDDTRRRLEPYGDRIRYIYQQNRGLSAARNAGIRAARGEWVALLDADDRWHPEKTEVQLEAAERAGGYDFIGTPGTQEPMPERLRREVETRRLGVEDILQESPVTASSVIVRRHCFEHVGGFDESLRSVEDRDMWLRLIVHYPALQVKSPCWSYRTHPGQMSRNAGTMHESYQAVLKKFFRRHPQPWRIERVGWARHYLDSAVAYLEQGERDRARDLLLQSLTSWPLPLRREASTPRLKLLVRSMVGEEWTSRLSAMVSTRQKRASPVAVGPPSAPSAGGAPRVEPPSCPAGPSHDVGGGAIAP